MSPAPCPPSCQRGETGLACEHLLVAKVPQSPAGANNPGPCSSML